MDFITKNEYKAHLDVKEKEEAYNCAGEEKFLHTFMGGLSFAWSAGFGFGSWYISTHPHQFIAPSPISLSVLAGLGVVGAVYFFSRIPHYAREAKELEAELNKAEKNPDYNEYFNKIDVIELERTLEQRGENAEAIKKYVG